MLPPNDPGQRVSRALGEIAHEAHIGSPEALSVPAVLLGFGRATTNVVREPYTPYAAAACSLPLRPSKAPPGHTPKMLPARHLLLCWTFSDGG